MEEKQLSFLDIVPEPEKLFPVPLKNPNNIHPRDDDVMFAQKRLNVFGPDNPWVQWEMEQRQITFIILQNDDFFYSDLSSL